MAERSIQSGPSGLWQRALLLAFGVVIGGLLVALVSGKDLDAFWSGLSTFATIFLGIFIEAAPFLMIGTLASGLVEVFLPQDALQRWLPGGVIRGAMAGAALGFLFPVCECGTVPLARRLFRKGMPVSIGIAFLLSAPVVNPVVLASTASAFGFGPMLGLRFGLTFLIAAATGLVFSAEPQPGRILLPGSLVPIGGGSGAPTRASESMLSPVGPPDLQQGPTGLRNKLTRAGQIAAGEFYEMGRFLVLGAALAALMQTLVPQSALLQIGSGPLLSIIAMIGLAIVLSVCSTVDSFVALAFAGTFTQGSLLAFLVYGPMVDIKSTLMYLTVFRRKTVIYLILLPLAMTLVAAVYLNLFVLK